MQVSLTTPAIIFPAVTLLMLAYGNRYLAIAGITRSLHTRYLAEGSSDLIRGQIENLRLRLSLIRRMQSSGIISLLLCVFSTIALYLRFQIFGEVIFALSLLSMVVSLLYCLREISLSGGALEIELSDMEN